MNTIDNEPEREPAERSAGSTNLDNRTPLDIGARSNTFASFKGKGTGEATRDLFDDVGFAPEVRNVQQVPGKAASQDVPHRPALNEPFGDANRDDKAPAPGVSTQREPQPSPEAQGKERELGDTKNVETDEVPSSKAAVPKSLAKRYLFAENKFYFRDDPNLLAFEDKGKRLSTEHNDPQIAQSMVELAQAKNWNSIKVKGTVEFKREVWLAASLRGLDVQGYEPRAVDKARLAEMRSEFMARHQNSIEPGIDREKPMTQAADAVAAKQHSPRSTDKSDTADDPYRNLTKQQRVAVDTLRAILTERGDSKQAVEMAASLALERFHQRRVYVGRLLNHGPAPYEHKPDEKTNYFVTLKTPNGEQTIWGVDLERAMATTGAKPGDVLVLVHQGKKKVTVLAHERDAAGKTTGKEVETVVDRNAWAVRGLDKLREEAQVRMRAAAEQTARNQPEVRVYDLPSPAVRHARVPDDVRVREQAPLR